MVSATANGVVFRGKRLIAGEIRVFKALFVLFQTEISKRLNAIIVQILPFLSQEHQQQVASAVDRAKQITMSELQSMTGVSWGRGELRGQSSP